MKKYLVLIALLFASGIAGGVWKHVSNRTKEISWQGWIEGDYLFLGPDEAGRLVSLDVSEGQSVASGTLLFTIQSDVQNAEWRQAKGIVDRA